MSKKIIFLTLIFLVGIANAQAKVQTEHNQILMRIAMLESALAPKAAEQVPIVWANAIKQRNGAIQYMLICPQLQAKYFAENLYQGLPAGSAKSKADYQANPWVTGWSSPRVISYNITRLADNQYAITYKWSDNAPNTTDTLTIQSILPNQYQSQQWCINHLVAKSFDNKIKELK